MVGRGEEGKYIYQKGYQHGQAIQLLSVIMLHDLRMTVCVCSEGSALFHIRFEHTSEYLFPGYHLSAVSFEHNQVLYQSILSAFVLEIIGRRKIRFINLLPE